MRIVCPICSAAYDVRDDLLGAGRTVRCTRCGEEWVAGPTTPDVTLESEPEPDAADPFGEERLADPPPAPRLSAMDRLASHPAPVPRRDGRLVAAWVASVVLLLAVVIGLIAWRGPIMHAWPPSIRLFDALGLGPPR